MTSSSLRLPFITALTLLWMGCRQPQHRCAQTSRSDLPGVSIRVLGNCRFTVDQASRGVKIPYEIVVTREVPAELSQIQNCDRPGNSGLIVSEMLGGDGHRYCDCDHGMCPLADRAVAVHPGVYRSDFEWDGREWGGLSDTSNPKGPPFPPGTYQLTIAAHGHLGKPSRSALVVDETQPPLQGFGVSVTADIELRP